MSHTDTERLIRQLIDTDQARSAALLEQASASAATTRERQLVAIAAAHLHAQGDRADFLAREHLVDYPDSAFARWIVDTGRHAC